MNILLISAAELDESNRFWLPESRFKNLQTLGKLQVGDSLKAGVINGQLGTATIVERIDSRTRLQFAAETNPPPPLNLSLILCLPRPKALKRIIQTVATLGIKELVLLNAWRVEKSYWQSPWLTDENLAQQSILGLEQACDTRLPIIHTERLFKPFVEDRLPAMLEGAQGLLAHPYA
ncbi:MAG: 16S rRNA (uracil(1498)-N(3))-methyltransferase, partial [bacterium]